MQLFDSGNRERFMRERGWEGERKGERKGGRARGRAREGEIVQKRDSEGDGRKGEEGKRNCNNDFLFLR